MVDFRLRLVPIVLAALTGVLSAQEAEGGAEAEPRSSGNEKKIPLKGLEDGIADRDLEIRRRALRGYVNPVISMKPFRLAPGESGVVHLTLMLTQQYVIKVGTTLDIKFPPEQGVAVLGPGCEIDPAKPGKLPTMFKGNPVYDNTVSVRVPVRILPEAEFGEHNVGFEVTVDIAHAQTGKFVGRFSGSADGKIKVGRSVPKPIPVPGAGGGAEDDSAAGSGGGAASAGVGAAGPAAAAAGQGLDGRSDDPGLEVGPMSVAADGDGAAGPAAAAATVPGGPGAGLPVDEGGLPDWLMLVLPIAGIAAVVGLLAIARKR